jgi:hypothetical protein
MQSTLGKQLSTKNKLSYNKIATESMQSAHDKHLSTTNNKSNVDLYVNIIDLIWFRYE